MQIVEKICLERVLARWLRGRRVVESSFCDTDTYAMRRFRAQIPEERKVRARHRGSDVCRSVFETDGEDFGLGGYGEETRAERKDTAAVGSSAFWEDSNTAAGTLA